jgi:hypothetical protein
METDQDGPSSPAATTPHLAGTEGLWGEHPVAEASAWLYLL